MDNSSSSQRFYYGWVIVALAFMMQALAGGATNSLYGVFAVPFSESFNASRTEVMFATASVAMIASGLLSPLAGIWLQRYARRPLMLTGGVALVLGLLAVSQATALWQISVIYFFCWSMGNTLFGTLAANTIVSHWFVAQRGKALGLAAIGMSLGTFVLPPVVTWIIVNHGWQTANQVLAGVVGIALPMIFFFYRENPEDVGAELDGGHDSSDENTEPMAVRSVLRSRYFWLITFCIGICFASFNGLTVNLVPMAIDQQVNAQTAAYLLSISALFGVIGKVVLGMSADRLAPQLVLTLPLLAISAACTILFGSPTFPRMMLAAGFIGLAAGGSIPVWGALIGRFFGRQSFSLVMGLMSPMLVPLVVICAPFISWVQEQQGSYNMALWVIIGSAVLAMFAASQLKENVSR